MPGSVALALAHRAPALGTRQGHSSLRVAVANRGVTGCQGFGGSARQAPSPAGLPLLLLLTGLGDSTATYPSVNTAGRETWHGCHAGTRRRHLIPGDGAFVRDGPWRGWFGIATRQQCASARTRIDSSCDIRDTRCALSPLMSHSRQTRHWIPDTDSRQQLECSSQTGHAPRGLC